jgi:hypothetical protein
MAVARPIPESPPVIIAFLPWSFPAALYFWLLPSAVGHLAFLARELLASDRNLVACCRQYSKHQNPGRKRAWSWNLPLSNWNLDDMIKCRDANSKQVSEI